MTSLGRRAEEVLERLGDTPSVHFEGRWHGSGELAGRARRAARGLVELGVAPGDRVVVVMANCPEVGITYAALWRAGAVPTPVLFLLTEDELRAVVFVNLEVRGRQPRDGPAFPVTHDDGHGDELRVHAHHVILADLLHGRRGSARLRVWRGRNVGREAWPLVLLSRHRRLG